MLIYQFERQRVVNRDNGKVKSITPLYKEELNKYNAFMSITSELLSLANRFPQDKFVVEMQNVPENQYELLKADVGIGDKFTDHSNKFFYNVRINAVVVVHKEY